MTNFAPESTLFDSFKALVAAVIVTVIFAGTSFSQAPAEKAITPEIVSRLEARVAELEKRLAAVEAQLALLVAAKRVGGTGTPDANAIATKDIGSLRVVLKSMMRVKLRNSWGTSLNGMRCSFEFINLETQRPIVVAMNAIASSGAIGNSLRSTLVDENGGIWSLLNSDVGGMSIVGVGQQQSGFLYAPAEIVTVLSRRDDLNSDVFQNGNRFIFGSMTEVSPGQSSTVTMTFVEDPNQTTSGAPSKFFQMAMEIVVGIAKTGTKKSYTLHNFTFDQITMRPVGSQ